MAVLAYALSHANSATSLPKLHDAEFAGLNMRKHSRNFPTSALRSQIQSILPELVVNSQIHKGQRPSCAYGSTPCEFPKSGTSILHFPVDCERKRPSHLLPSVWLVWDFPILSLSAHFSPLLQSSPSRPSKANNNRVFLGLDRLPSGNGIHIAPTPWFFPI